MTNALRKRDSIMGEKTFMIDRLCSSRLHGAQHLKRREGLVTRPLILLHVLLLRASQTKKASKVLSTDTIHIISVPSQTIYIWQLCKGMLHAMGRSLGRKSSSHYARPLAASPGAVTLYQVPHAT